MRRPAQRRARLVVDAAHQRQHPRHDGPVLRHLDVDAAPEREHFDDGFRPGRDRRLPQVDLAAAHDGGEVGALEGLRVAAPRDAAHDGQRAELRLAVRRDRAGACRRSRATPCSRPGTPGSAEAARAASNREIDDPRERASRCRAQEKQAAEPAVAVAAGVPQLHAGRSRRGRPARSEYSRARR